MEVQIPDLTRTPAAGGYAASIYVHFLINASHF